MAISLWLDIGFSPDPPITLLADTPVLPDPFRSSASSLATDGKKWVVCWESIDFDPRQDSLWIEGGFLLGNLHQVPRPHGSNHWGDKIEAVSFPASGPTGDNDNRTIIHANGSISVGNGLLSKPELERLGAAVKRNPGMLHAYNTLATLTTLAIEDSVQDQAGIRTITVLGRAFDSAGVEVVVPSLTVRIVALNTTERTVDTCSHLAVSLITPIFGDHRDRVTASVSSPGLTPVTKVIVDALARKMDRVFTPNTNHEASFSSNNTFIDGDIMIEGPNINVFHTTELVGGFDYANVYATDLLQNGAIKYRFTRPTEQGEYFQVEPGTYTHILEASTQPDPSFPGRVVKAISTVRYFKKNV